jgi:hypothetical protein
MGRGGCQKIFSVFNDISRIRKHYSGYILKADVTVRLILPIAACLKRIIRGRKNRNALFLPF